MAFEPLQRLFASFQEVPDSLRTEPKAPYPVQRQPSLKDILFSTSSIVILAFVYFKMIKSRTYFYHRPTFLKVKEFQVVLAFKILILFSYFFSLHCWQIDCRCCIRWNSHFQLENICI